MKHFEKFLERQRSYASRVCVESGNTSYSYAQLLIEFERWQLRFAQLNVGPGTVVAVRTDHSVFAMSAFLALCARGSIIALIPHSRDSARYLEDACAEALLELAVNGEYEWTSLANSRSHPLLEQLRSLGDGGFVIFTSGSTGTPKAALHSVERFLHKFSKPCRTFRTLAFFVLDHIAGLDTLFYTLAGGGTLIVLQHREIGAVLGVIDRHRAEVLPTSPSFLRMLCATGELGDNDLSSLRIITYGSELMDPTTLVRLNELFPGVQISQKYGNTEAGSPRSVSRANDSLWLRIGSGGVETKIVDGVLWIRSEGTILGYLNAPSPVDADGWYCTGDTVDVEGEWIRFRGRVNDIINVGGEKVSPAEVEQTILELEFVRDVVVAAKPHDLMGQVVVAEVVLGPGSIDQKVAASRIRAHCRQQLALYKVPVEIGFTGDIPVNERQKIRRNRTAE